MDNYLLIQNMQVTEASMDSSPITTGFPSISALMGFVHALQRKLQLTHPEIKFSRAGVCCHSFDPGIHNTGSGIKIAMSRNPPYERKHLDKGVPFIEEGKADLTISIITKIDCGSIIPTEIQNKVSSLLPKMRFSGGKIWEAKKIQYSSCSSDDLTEQKKLLRKLMPGFTLIDRHDLMVKSMEKGLDALDAILDHLEICRFESDNQNGDISWGRKSAEPGWLVPISVGYRVISTVGSVENQRDPENEHCFAENVLTLGEFIMPLRLDHIDSMLWESAIDQDQGLYIYKQFSNNKGE